MTQMQMMKDEILQMLDELSGYEAQTLNALTGRKCVFKDDEARLKVYRLQSPKMTERSRCGFCWDIALLTLSKLTAIGAYAYAIAAVEMSEDDFPLNHTTVVIRLADGFYIFEASWSSHAGLHGPFTNEQDIYAEVASWLDEERGDMLMKLPINVYRLYKHPEVGCTAAAYLSIIKSNLCVLQLKANSKFNEAYERILKNL